MFDRTHRLVFTGIAGVLASCAHHDNAPRDGAVEPASAAASTSQPVAATEVELDIKGPSAVLPTAITSFGAATHDGSLYVLGGYFGRPHAYSEAGQTGDLLRLDLETGKWSRLGGIDKAQSVTLVAHEGKLIRVGGMQARNPEGQDADLHSVDNVEVFDIATSTWAALPPMPQPRSSHDATVIDGALWVAGGWTLAGESHSWSENVLRLDLSDPSKGWETIEVPFKRRAVAAGGADGKLVVVGGIGDDRRPSSEVDVYDPATKTWSKGPALPGPGFGAAAVSHGGSIIVSGMDGVVQKWRPGQEQWTALTTLAYPRFFHRMATTKAGELVVLGGIRGMASGSRIRPIERIAIEAPNQSRIQLALPFPLKSKNRQGVAVHGDAVYFFGGNLSLGQHDFGPEFFTDRGQALDLASLTFKDIAPYPHKRQSMSTFVTTTGQVVSVAGFGHDGEVARTHPEIFAYDPVKDAWAEIGLLPGQGRTQFGLAPRKDEVVLFGGLDYDPRREKKDQFRHEMGLLRAPLDATKMSFEATDLKLREPRRAFAGRVIDDRYYVVGGMKDGFALVDTCEYYDFASKKWSSFSCPSHPRLSGKMVALDGKLYLTGGSAPTGPDGKLAPDPSLESYDPATDRWTTLDPQLPIQPKHLTLATYGDRLVFISTHNEEGMLNLMLLDPAG
ncbi:MAG: kelch repeat-containing protein [Myxococcota bacterium]